MKKILFIGLFIFSPSLLLAKNPLWLVGQWSGEITGIDEDSDQMMYIKLIVPSVGNNLRMISVNLSFTETFRQKTMDTSSVTYFRNLSKRNSLMSKIIITLMDNNYINVDLFGPEKGSVELIATGRLKKV